MDKSVECRFTSEFWRNVNEQYFMVESPVTLLQMNHCDIKIPNYESQSISIEKILNVSGNQSQTQQLDRNNLKLRLGMLLSEKEEQSEPLKDLMDEMIDSICYRELVDGLEKTQNLLKNINQRATEKQVEIYNQEAAYLQQIHSKINCPDQLGQVIMEMEESLDKVKQSNQDEMQKLQGHIQEINNTVIHQYSILQIGEFSLKLSRTKVEHHQDEKDAVLKFIIQQQDYQIAEGIGRATLNSTTNLITVQFEKYIHPTPIDLSLATFQNYQRLREIPLELSTTIESECQMCHNCRQMVDLAQLKQCSYNHLTMNLHEYNEDLLIQQRYSISQKDQRKFFQDLYSANYVIENSIIQCQRYFCHKCLKYEFDQFDFNTPEWTCPLCMGLCTCSQCLRNDQIYKLKRMYLEIGGDLDTLYEQSFFELLVKDKRKLISSIPLEFMNTSKSQSEYEETLTPKSVKNIKKSINKMNRKKKISETSKNTTMHKLSHIENSSSSIFIS